MQISSFIVVQHSTLVGLRFSFVKDWTHKIQILKKNKSDGLHCCRGLLCLLLILFDGPTESPITPSGDTLLNTNKIRQQQRRRRLCASALTTGSPDLLGCDWSSQMNKHLSHPAMQAGSGTILEVCINTRLTGSVWQINGKSTNSVTTIAFLQNGKKKNLNKNITAF